jgi:ribosomal protein S27AE
MTHDSRLEKPSDARRARQPAARRSCPRCGAALGVLAAAVSGSAAAAGRAETERAEGASALYCGCCGLVVPPA